MSKDNIEMYSTRAGELERVKRQHRDVSKDNTEKYSTRAGELERVKRQHRDVLYRAGKLERVKRQHRDVLYTSRRAGTCEKTTQRCTLPEQASWNV